MHSEVNGNGNGVLDIKHSTVKSEEPLEGRIASISGPPRKTIQVPFRVSKSFQAQCLQENLDPLTLLRAIWLFVLRTYGGTTSPCFGHAPDISKASGQTRTWNAPLSICSGRISSTDSIRQFCSTIQIESTNEFHQSIFDLCREGSCNTAMFVSNSLESPIFSQKQANSELRDLFIDDFDIAIDIEYTHGRILPSLSYLASSISTHQAIDIAHTFEKIALHALYKPDSLIDAIDFLSSRDLRQIQLWNNTPPESTSSCVHDLIEQQAKATPYSDAVCAWDGNLTYAELEDYASSLACVLNSFDVGPEAFVPIYLNKSKWSIVATLAVLKAGGACFHLSPDHPVSRTLGIIGDTKASVVITSSEFSSRFNHSVDNVVCLSSSFFEKHEFNKRELSHTVRPQNSAFIIFTSGSTGKPKGVIKEHGAIATSARAHGKIMNVHGQSRVLSFASFVWDISINDIVSTLIHGACLCIPSDFDRINRLVPFMHESQVTLATFTPTVARSINPDDVSSLQTLVLGGESVSMSSVKRWFGKVSLIGNYGASETSISVACVMSKNHHKGTLGRAVSCTRTWIVEPDNHHKLVPIGASGELVIEGPSLARGYFDNDKATNEAFISHPAWLKDIDEYNRSPNQRFYKTGDLAHYNLDGSVTLVGRKDRQVKLRGQRIEIGEVEHHLRTYLPKKAEVVANLIDLPGRKKTKALAAFVSLSKTTLSSSDDEESTEAIRSELISYLSPMNDRLNQSLPSYMVPSIYVPIAEVPRTLNGKLDIKQINKLSALLKSEDLISINSINKKDLPADADCDSERKDLPNSKLTDLEHLMAKHWAQVLGLEEKTIKQDDCFFRLGGNSVDAMNIVAIIRADSLEITVADIFKHSTLSAMSQRASPGNAKQADEITRFEMLESLQQPDELLKEAAAVCNLNESDIEDIFPSTADQSVMMASTVLDPNTYVAKHTFELPRGMTIEDFKGKWDQLTLITPELRTHFAYLHPHGWMHVRVKFYPAHFEEVDQKSLEDVQMSRFCIGNGTILHRCLIIPGSENEPHQFIWIVHHNVYDGWGIRVLRKRFEQICAGQTLQPQPDYRSLMKYTTSGKTKDAAEYWKGIAKGHTSLQFPMLPHVEYEPNATNRMRMLIKTPKQQLNSNITETILVQAAWTLVVSRYTNSPEVVLTTVQSGRTAPVEGILDMVGTALLDLPVRTSIDFKRPADKLMIDVQDQYSASMPYDTYGLLDVQVLSHDAFTFGSPCHWFLMHPDDEAESKIYKEGQLNELSRVVGDEYAGVALAVDISPVPEGFWVNLWSDDNVFTASQIERLGCQFEQTVLQFYDQSNHSKPLSDLKTLTPKDVEALSTWYSEAPKVAESCVHDLIRQNFERNADAPAVSSWDGNLSYTQLWSKSSRLALKLQHTVQAGSIVSVLIPKSKAKVIAILAALRAGTAFQILDPEDAIKNLKSVVDLSQSKLVVASPETEQIARLISQDVLTFEDEDSTCKFVADFFLIPTIGSTNAAFVTTKYIDNRPATTLVVSHGKCVSSLKSQIELREMDATSRMLQFSNGKFDTCIEEILAPLLSGGCVCLAKQDDLVLDLAGAINGMEVNTAILPSTIASSLTPEEVPSLSSLNLLVVRNENRFSNAALIERWVSSVRLGVTCHMNGLPISASYDKRMILARPENIGKPVDCRLWITEPQNPERLATVGAVGEMIIEENISSHSSCTQSGKLDMIIPTPAWYRDFKPAAGQVRMTRSNVLAKYEDDGSLNIVSSANCDRKLDIDRIYPWEIESRLTFHELVASSVVLRPNSGPYEGELVAIYQNRSMDESSRKEPRMISLSPEDNSQLPEDIATLSAYLTAHVPHRMRPTIWIPVNRLSLSIAEHLNRSAATIWLSRLSPSELSKIASIQDRSAAPSIPSTEPIAVQLSMKIAEFAGHWNPEHRAAFEGKDILLRTANMHFTQMASLICFIKQIYGVDVGPETVFDGHMTVRKLAETVEKKIADREKFSISSGSTRVNAGEE